MQKEQADKAVQVDAKQNAKQPNEPLEEFATKTKNPQAVKSLKIKTGIFFGYNGQSFKGLQYQRDTDDTIENVIHKILLHNCFILESNASSLRKIKWSRAGRTDKKVHALCNGISVNLEYAPKYVIPEGDRNIDMEKVIKDINAELPMDIRIFAMKKLGKNFDMRHDTFSRVYNYVVPIKLFQSYQKLKKQEKTFMNQLQIDEITQKLNKLCEKYLGTHNFHNFTKGYKMDDPKCDRYIIKMGVQVVEKQVVEDYLTNKLKQKSNEERGDHQLQYETFLRFTLVGQSFIYHQIRKMVGLLIKIFSEDLNGEEAINKAFSKEKYELYLAPGEGLYLNRMTFEGYNKKKQPQFRVELSEEEESRITRYRGYLESKILNHEFEQKVFSVWIHNWHNYGEEARNKMAEEEEEEEVSKDIQ